MSEISKIIELSRSIDLGLRDSNPRPSRLHNINTFRWFKQRYSDTTPYKYQVKLKNIQTLKEYEQLFLELRTLLSPAPATLTEKNKDSDNCIDKKKLFDFLVSHCSDLTRQQLSQLFNCPRLKNFHQINAKQFQEIMLSQNSGEM